MNNRRHLATLLGYANAMTVGILVLAVLAGTRMPELSAVLSGLLVTWTFGMLVRPMVRRFGPRSV